MVVMKFGGTSLGTPERIRAAGELIAREAGVALHTAKGEPNATSDSSGAGADGDARRKLPVVVLSAHDGVTNMLQAAAEAALTGDVSVAALLVRHGEIADGLGVDVTPVRELLEECEALLRGISLVGELTSRSLDYVMSYGERCSVRLVAAYGRRCGLPLVPVDAWDIGLVTDSRFGAARPVDSVDAAVRAGLDPILARGEIPVVTGYIAKDAQGQVTTLGRNGSDLTATVLGAALHAREVQIWTDVEGVMTADPSRVPSAMPLPLLTFDEAAELAYFGARVLHPSTLRPAIRTNTDVRVLCTMRPDSLGTLIRPRLSRDDEAYRNDPLSRGAIKSIVSKGGQIVVNVASDAMFLRSGYLGELFTVLGRHDVVVDMVATSEVSVSFTTDSDHGLNAAVGELERLPGLPDVTVETGRGIIGVIGENIRARVGLAGEVFGVMRDIGINVEMISLGASKMNISFLVDEERVGDAVRALHKQFFER